MSQVDPASPPLCALGAEEATAFGQRPVVFHHRLHTSALFTDDALAALLDAHPRDALFIHSMGTDPARSSDWRSGSAGERSGAELLEATRQGRLWLNIKNLERTHEGFAALAEGLRAALDASVPGLRPHDVHTTLLISSPKALVYFHADAEPNVLWHLRGKKRVFVYPPDERCLKREDLEVIFSRESHEELPYSPSFDALAQVFDLEPGQALSWPHNSPHRIENADSLNVSFSTEFYTPAARRKERVYCANRLFSRLTGLRFDAVETRGPSASAKVFTYRVLRKLLAGRKQYKQHTATFVVDPAAPLGLKEG